MQSLIGAKILVIGGVYGTTAEHVALMQEEGRSAREVDYFIGHALDAELRGVRPGPAAVPITAYRKMASWS